MTPDNDDLIRRGDALAACQKIADDAKCFGLPIMTMGAKTCRDAILAIPIPPANPVAEAARVPEIAALIEAAKEQVKLYRVLRPNGYAGEICDRDLRATLRAIAGGDA